MSYLAFTSRAAVIHLPGRQVHAILGLAQSAIRIRLWRRAAKACSVLSGRLPKPWLFDVRSW